MRKVLTASALSLSLLSGVGCAGGGAGDAPGGFAVPDGKQDNFFSRSAQEFTVDGLSTVVLEAEYADKSDEEKLARAHELVALKQVAITWFLNEYMIEKESEDANHDWGGFHALAKHDGSVVEIAPGSPGSLEYVFNFRQLLAGESDLMSMLPTTTTDASGKRHFALQMGKPTNAQMAELTTNHEWYRNAPWDAWDPTKHAANEIETLDLVIDREKPSADSYFDVNALTADGKITVGVHFGWDYHSSYHLKHAEELYRWLTARGYDSPVASFADYTRTSGALTKTVTMNGKPVRVEIALYWGKPDSDTDPDTDEGGRVLESDMRESFRSREVIVYSGHSGPLYGFALANWRKTEEGDLDDSEMASLELPEKTYQLVLAEGCDTLSVGAQLLANPAKLDQYLDVITTTAPSNASTPETVKRFLTALVGDGQSAYAPGKISQLLDSLDDASSWFTTMYGVHGIDDNPHRHPFANAETLGQPCTSNSDCGGVGNACTKNVAGDSECAFDCTANDGCPTGFSCMDIAQGTTINNQQCVRK